MTTVTVAVSVTRETAIDASKAGRQVVTINTDALSDAERATLAKAKALPEGDAIDLTWERMGLTKRNAYPYLAEANLDAVRTVLAAGVIR